MEAILVQKNTHGKVKYIKLTLKGGTVYREWGILEGKEQTTQNTYGALNVGKKNEKSPEVVAKEDFERLIKNKTKEGYLQVDDLDNLPELNTTEDVDFENLQTKFCCSKPRSKFSEKAVQKVKDAGNERSFIKYNGSCHYILITPSGEVKIYTRRIDDHTIKYPEVREYVESLNLKPCSLFITEFVIDPLLGLPHMEAFNLMSSISKSNVHKGKPKEDQTKNFELQEAHEVRACVFGVLYYDSVEMWNLPYSDQLDILDEHFKSVKEKEKLFKPEEVFCASAANLLKYAEDRLGIIEGLITFDVTTSLEITFNGKPKRRAAWKVKAKGEIDVIAVGYNEGTGDHQGMIGSLQLASFNEDNELVSRGDCGSGISDEMCDPDKWTFPCVVEIGYDNIFPTGKFQFPVFNKIHEDKKVEDLKHD